MGRVRAVIFAVDELLHPTSAAATAEELAEVVATTARWHEVWLVGKTDLPLRPAVRERIRRAPTLEAVTPPKASGVDDATVLVVGSQPGGAIRFANARALSGALVAPDADSHQAETLDEAPDFILPRLGDVPHLIARLERDETDFQGVE